MAEVIRREAGVNTDLDGNGFANINLVLGRGYVSEEVIAMLVKGRRPFVMMATSS